MKTQREKHTATPWITANYKTESGNWHINATTQHNTIAEVYEDKNLSAQANAEYIVRCVNNHEALVEALIEADRYLDKVEAWRGHDVKWNDIKQAIAQAEGSSWKKLNKKVNSMFTSEGR